MAESIKYILVSGGPLIGPFDTKEAAEAWAKAHSFDAKWVEELVSPSFYDEGGHHGAH